jgi:serine kinase of HPr protein (carbohydrate metabolism regulator)
VSTAAALHATCVVVGEAGILLRGPSGSGKSMLARRLVEAATARGLFARLVADDRVRVRISAGRALASGHPALKGYVEVRGIGIVPAEPEPACVLALVVDLEEAPGERLPVPGLMRSRSLGIDLPRIAAGPGDADRVLLAIALVEETGGFQEPSGEVARSWGLHLSPHRTK